MKLFRRFIYAIIIGGLIAGFCSCGGGDSAADEESTANSQTPVTVTAIDSSALADSIELNATSTFLQKNYVKANATGYIRNIKLQPGHSVEKGQLMFTIQTKEAQTIGNTINVLDTTLKFSGVNNIRAAKAGFVTQLMHQVGDYVQDGEQLAVISDRESFAFVLQLPYELRSVIAGNQHMVLTLPDGEKLDGYVASLMPSVDSLSQTQGIVIKVNSSHPIPDNLVAKALIIKKKEAMRLRCQKRPLLSNETQNEFWVMRLKNDTTAVKTLVRPGIQSGGRVEILSPAFGPRDRIVVTGNYGLADTAKIKIVKP